jgi:hypothetical protein
MAMEDRHFIVFQWADTPIANLDSKRVLKISSQHPETSAAYGICSFLGPQKWGKHRWTRLVDAAKLSLRPSLWNLWAFVDVLYWQLKEAPVLKLELLQASGDENCDDSEGWRSNFWISTSCNTPENFVNCWLQ